MKKQLNTNEKQTSIGSRRLIECPRFVSFFSNPGSFFSSFSIVFSIKNKKCGRAAILRFATRPSRIWCPEATSIILISGNFVYPRIVSQGHFPKIIQSVMSDNFPGVFRHFRTRSHLFDFDLKTRLNGSQKRVIFARSRRLQSPHGMILKRRNSPVFWAFSALFGPFRGITKTTLTGPGISDPGSLTRSFFL